MQKGRSLTLVLNNDIFKYALEQCSGIVIALVLIVRIESKLDNMSNALIRLTEIIASNKK